MHVRTIGIKNTGHFYPHLMLPVIIKEECFSATLTFVIARALADGIHMSPITFRLRVHLWVAIHFTGRRLEYFSPRTLG